MLAYGLLLVLSFGIPWDSRVAEESAFQATTEASTQQTNLYRPLEGVIKVPFRSEENVTAENGTQCFLKRCRLRSRCAASFHPPSHTCVSSAPVFELLNLKESSSVIEQTPGEAWETYSRVSNSLMPDLAPPSGLWLFDSVSKGRNFGAEGRRLDGSFEDGKWTEDGPRGRKLPLKYPLLSKLRSEVKIPNKHNGEHLIDFSKPFTIAMWVKVVAKGLLDRASYFWLDDCASSDGVGFVFGQWRSSGWLYLRLNSDDHYYRSVDFPFPFYDEWRHVAAVYNGPGDVQLYSNGNLLKLKLKSTTDASITNLDDICLVKLHSRPMSVACLSIFEHPLSKAQVAHVMQKCP